ncbi:ankyrin, partial [Melanomma pulvis-pyrius CBS 109.77]
WLDSEKDFEIIKWLTPIDYGPQQSDFLRRRQEGTGTWLLHTNEFNTWLNQKGQTLLCTGIPGAGKTILTAIVVNHLKNQYAGDLTIGIAYIYCNYRRQDEQEAEDLLLSLLKQFVQEQQHLPECVKDLYGRHNPKRTRPSLGEIEEALLSVATCLSRVFIVVDALDECNASDNGRNQFLSTVLDLQSKTGANIFTTSRINKDITKRFENALSLQIRAKEEDVECYLDGQMLLLQSDILDHDLRVKVKRDVVQAVDGMFLLAQLHMNTLKVQPTKGHIKEVLQHIGKGIDGLDSTYKQAMERIEDQGKPTRELANSILGWIIHAKRPLSTVELQHALAIRPHTKWLDADYLPSAHVLRSVCAGLVTVDEDSDIIRLVHYTTQQYLEKTWTSWFPNAQIDITNACVTYLLFDVFETGFCKSIEDFEARLQKNGLYDYVAENWGHHARTVLADERLILNLLESPSKLSAASQAGMAEDLYLDLGPLMPTKLTGVHVAAYFGLDWAIRGLLINSSDLAKEEVDSQDVEGRTPLSWAAQFGHEAVVKLLLDTGKVDIDREDYDGKTPLLWAASGGNEAIVKMMLETGKVNVNVKTKHGTTPL